MCGRSLHGNREVSRPTRAACRCWPASGRRGAVADDARTREVRPRHSSWEADEQSRATGRGVGGAKGEGRGERGPAKHAPGTGPGSRVPGAGTRTTGRSSGLPSNTQGGSRMRESRTYGSVRGALRNERPYREPRRSETNKGRRSELNFDPFPAPGDRPAECGGIGLSCPGATERKQPRRSGYG